MSANQLSSINHIVVLMLENRSFDHMLGFLYKDTHNVSLAGQPFEGLVGTESNLDSSGQGRDGLPHRAYDPEGVLHAGRRPWRRI